MKRLQTVCCSDDLVRGHARPSRALTIIDMAVWLTLIDATSRKVYLNLGTA
jgi:hypothetical protein